jgi:hypothetical protein
MTTYGTMPKHSAQGPSVPLSFERKPREYPQESGLDLHRLALG